LKAYGWDKQIFTHLRYGGKLIGLCGGYQMLGEIIDDPLGIEDKPGSETGLDLIKMHTKLMPEKKLENVQAELVLQEINVPVKGYEIHCGETVFNEEYKAPILLNKRSEGVISHDNQILGTYLHGLFDQPEATNKLLQWAGFNKNSAIDLNLVREEQLNRLADCLESELSEAFINQLLFRQNKDKDNCLNSIKTEIN
jgi:adenosylcobyric acid synthase